MSRRDGGLLYAEGSHPATLTQTLLVPLSALVQHRQQLAEVFQRLQARFPGLIASDDNCFRLTDWTFDIQGLSTDELEAIDHCCQSWGWGFTYSTIQCHIRRRSQDKATGLQTVLQKYFPDYTAENVLTVGDSPNDESLFDASRFPLSVGVANVLDYSAQLLHLPASVTTAAEGEGFLELAHLLLRSRQT